MKVSVVTISYNQQKFLKECIDSVLSQGEVDIEYILVDPGSTDGSRDIINSYGESIIKVFEKDQGPADGLNKGFAKATGDIYCYLNSDDAFLPGSLKKIVDYFGQNQDIDVVCGNGYITDSNSIIVRKVFSDNFDLISAAYGASVSIQPSTFFRASSFTNCGGFNVLNRSNWDGELLIDMALSGAVVANVNLFLSCYRVYGESITGSGGLLSAHNQHSARMFKKIMQRDKMYFDPVVELYFRLKKHFMSPRATLERLIKGPIFGTGEA